MTSTPGSKLTGLLVLACLALIVIDLALALRVRELNAQVSELSAAASEARPSFLGSGERLPPLTLLSSSAEIEPLRVAGLHTATLLLITAASCDACEDSRPAWAEVARLAEGSPLRVLELILEADPADLSERGHPYEAVTAGGDAWDLVGRLPGIPAALLVDEQNVVRRAFYGNAHDGLREAVEELLLP